MGPSLYQIEQEYLRIAELLLASGGEATEEIEQALTINKDQLQAKAVNYGFVCKELEMKSSMIDQEIERLKGIQKSIDKTHEKLKNSISGAMQFHGIEKVEIPTLKLSFRKSETVEVNENYIIPDKFIKRKETETIDKAAIKEAIKQGQKLDFAFIQEHQNLQIR